MPFVLASASTARQQLLHQAGLVFEICPADLDEGAVKRAFAARGLNAATTALELALRKAQTVARPGELVIGCDQILVCESKWYDKPPDMAAARAQLLQLRGRPHVLETAIVALRDGTALWQHIETPRLVMREFSEHFLDSYLAQEGRQVLGSVGAYRLEGPGIQLFEHIAGDHTAILGLPMLPLLGFLRDNDMIQR